MSFTHLYEARIKYQRQGHIEARLIFEGEFTAEQWERIKEALLKSEPYSLAPDKASLLLLPPEHRVE